MRYNRKRIPEVLRDKVIGFISTYPGCGKTYIKDLWAKRLREFGYSVKNLGTTQKASTDRTVAAESGNGFECNFTITKKHPQTYSFYFIDEAFMFTQEKIDKLKECYPNCCFFLIGDPLQFDILEKGSFISKLDYCFNLDEPFRQDINSDLFKAIKTVKEGGIPKDFIKTHINGDYDVSKDLIVCYTKDNRDFINEFIQEKKKSRLGYVYRSMNYHVYPSGQTIYLNRPSWKNGELWECVEEFGVGIDIKKLSSEDKIYVKNDELKLWFSCKPCINNHKIQGDTIRERNLIIVIDDYLLSNRNLLLRHLYVALSRAVEGKQIKFLPEDATKLLKLMEPSKPVPMKHNLKIDQNTNSKKLAKEHDLIAFFVGLFNKNIFNEEVVGSPKDDWIESLNLEKVYSSKELLEKYNFCKNTTISQKKLLYLIRDYIKPLGYEVCVSRKGKKMINFWEFKKVSC